MSQDFKTQEELLRYVLGGGAVINNKTGKVVKLIDGYFQDQYGDKWSLSVPEGWSKYVEPLKLEFEGEVEKFYFENPPHQKVLRLPNHIKVGTRFHCVLTEKLDG